MFPVENAELVQELMPYRHWLNGRILNAGCGKRFINLGKKSVRLDIDPVFATAVDLIADVHYLPFANSTFDSLVSVAVLEHTRYAWEVAREFMRVLKPGGVAVVAIPFMQPRHGEPDDYVRFTDTGIRALMEWAGFVVIEVRGVHTLGYTVEWLLREVLSERPMLRQVMYPLRRVIFPLLRKGQLLSQPVENLRSAYYVVARKPYESVI